MRIVARNQRTSEVRGRDRPDRPGRPRARLRRGEGAQRRRDDRTRAPGPGRRAAKAAQAPVAGDRLAPRPRRLRAAPRRASLRRRRSEDRRRGPGRRVGARAGGVLGLESLDVLDLLPYCRRCFVVQFLERLELHLDAPALSPHAPRADGHPVDEDRRSDQPAAGHDRRPLLGAGDEVAVAVSHQVVVPGGKEPDDRPRAGRPPRASVHARSSPIRISTSSPPIRPSPARTSRSGSPDQPAKSASVAGPKARR